MDIPATLLGWLNLLAYFWAFLAYLVAAVAGGRALHRAYATAPAAPFCLVIDATRWVFHQQMSPLAWRPRDFIALGVFGTVAACLIAALSSLDFLMALNWQKLGQATSLLQVADDILTGSALIILHCGIALRFKKEKV